MIQFDGAKYGSVEHWKEGIITRGVLLDVPRHRGVDYVTQETPIHGWELQEICDAQGVQMEPGDALVVYGGREKWNADGNPLWGSDPTLRPGLHASCLKFIRQSDCCVLVWDMMDHTPQRVRPALGRYTGASSPTASASWTTPCCNPWPRRAPPPAAGSSCSPSTRCAWWEEPAPP